MGAPMARRLAAAGFELAVFDISPEAVERFAAETKCERPRTLSELGRASRVVITMLPDGGVVRNVLLGDGGMAPALAPGTIVIDMSSASATGTRELSAELGKRGVVLIDAPVSGGVQKAREGALTIMAGGDPQILERCGRILGAMGRVFPTGPIGSGHAVKALNNYLSATALAATAEAVIAAERFGIDPAVMLRIISASSGRNSATDSKYPSFVLPRTFDSGFALALMLKDLRLALDLIEGSGAPATLARTCTEVWAKADERLGRGADHTEIVKYLESLATPPSGR